MIDCALKHARPPPWAPEEEEEEDEEEEKKKKRNITLSGVMQGISWSTQAFGLKQYMRGEGDRRAAQTAGYRGWHESGTRQKVCMHCWTFGCTFSVLQAQVVRSRHSSQACQGLSQDAFALSSSKITQSLLEQNRNQA